MTGGVKEEEDRARPEGLYMAAKKNLDFKDEGFIGKKYKISIRLDFYFRKLLC